MLHLRARELGYYDQIRVNTQGFVTETTLGNLFLVHGDTVSTPAEETGLLPGVARSIILERQAVQLDPQIKSAQLNSAEAIFLTNSIVGVLPVHQIDVTQGNGRFYSSHEHPLVLNIRKQFANWQLNEALNI